MSSYIRRTPTCLTIGAGLLVAGYQYWVGPLSLSAQLFFCIGLLAFVGIPHGALDHLVEQEHSLRQAQRFSLTRFIIKYLFMIGAYGLGWMVFPVLSFILFLLISAWHFGETDLEHAPETGYWSLTRLLAGGFVLAFILVNHADEVTPVIARIVKNDVFTMQVWNGAISQRGPLLRGWATLLGVLAMLAFGHQPIPVNGWRLGRLGVVILLTYTLPLLPAFMLYFGGWHSLSSFGTILSYLQRSANPVQSIWKLWYQSVPLTLLAFGFLFACSSIWNRYLPLGDPLPYLFILLSTITLPHIQVMHKLDRRYK
ncbi:Brp/Blh family beta-carotene 15,15'-dioxygenase [Spirosoma utsteinense]|uniref:Probable beta-carotene 15,15'-dioxygenase n=1 Tax=Spirosoma utsteinense TaxID=2585773 RepID=A0ABR6WE76_9BACT|nr:Brp/Blh family beta-carotene 15,15'-dioxygenase [Spirosoma utsteinense]MBC3794305.1 Brp/Blh family beta-carotene 15,15'-monooxygenase [Spirosoma utsteinense]